MGTSHAPARRGAVATRPLDGRVLVVALVTLVFAVLSLSEVPPEGTPTEMWASLASSFVWTTLVWDGSGLPGRRLVPHVGAQALGFVLIAAGFGWHPVDAAWMALANVGGGVLMAVLYARFLPREHAWAPTTAAAHIGLLSAALASGAVVALLGGFPHLEVGELTRLTMWWVVRNTVYAYVGGVTFLVLFSPRRPDLPPNPRWAAFVLGPLGAAALWATYLGPELPLTWSILIPAVMAGSMLTPRGAAGYALSVAVGGALATLHPMNQFGYEGFLPGSLIIDMLLTASTFVTLQLAILRDQRSIATQELDRQTRDAQEQAALLATVFDTMSDGLVVVDDHRRVVMHNTAARHLLGHRIPLGQELAWSGGDADGTDPLTGQVVVTREDGQRVLDVGTWPLPAVTGRTVVLFSDVTAQRERLGELTSFAGVVAHDLRSPLASLSGWLEMAADTLEDVDGPAGEAVSSFVDRARMSGDRMRQVIEDWLSYTVQRDGLLAPSEVALKPLVTAVVAPYASHGEDLAPVFAVDVDDTVQADPALTRQLIANLVGNAVKYAAPGTRPEVSIVSTPDEEPGFVRVDVADRGIGLPDGEEELVFREFHRAPGHAADFAGTGLGLSLCRKIVVRHGGHISARNDGDRGTVFSFTLPAA